MTWTVRRAGAQLAGEQAQQGRLARPVGPDEPAAARAAARALAGARPTVGPSSAVGVEAGPEGVEVGGQAVELLQVGGGQALEALLSEGVRAMRTVRASSLSVWRRTSPAATARSMSSTAL